MRYGNLTVIERAEDAIYQSGKLVRWKCLCDCGKETTVIGCNLNKTKSCGCQMHNGLSLKDLTGKTFGLLKVISRTQDFVLPSGQKQTMWLCECECGSIVKIRGSHLKDGFTKSCGCIKSYGEREIAKLLSKYNVEFEREYEFYDLVNSKGNVLKFDFAIKENNNLKFLIEFQGEQYFKDKCNTYFGKMQREETDDLKKSYCLTHNISLYYINYNDNIENSLNAILNISHDNTVPSAS